MGQFNPQHKKHGLVEASLTIQTGHKIAEPEVESFVNTEGVLLRLKGIVSQDTSGKLPPVSTTPVVNLQPVSMTPVANIGNTIRQLTP
jgi:hypothetical protein